MSRLDNDAVFHKKISQMGGYGITQDYLDTLVDKHFPVEGTYRMSDALRASDLFLDPEDINDFSIW